MVILNSEITGRSEKKDIMCQGDKSPFYVFKSQKGNSVLLLESLHLSKLNHTNLKLSDMRTNEYIPTTDACKWAALTHTHDFHHRRWNSVDRVKPVYILEYEK